MIQKQLSAMIMAGGRSLRMRSSGCATHKGLRKVLGLPLIEWNLATLVEFGFNQVYVAVSACEPELKQWLAERGAAITKARAVTLEILIEEEPLGTIGATGRLPLDVSDVVIVNVDNLTDLDLRSLLEFHQSSGAALSIASHEHMFRIPFGRLVLDGEEVRAYEEKPGIAVQISSGTYALNRRAIEEIPKHRRTDVPQLVSALLDAGEKVAAYLHSAAWIDANDESDLADAEALLLSRRTRTNQFPGGGVVQSDNL
jgi:NDP-sugar pyrophosphorylase family protein